MARGNQDGSDYNYSWNCGVEGPTRKVSVRQMRERQIKKCLSDDAAESGCSHDLSR